MGAGPAPQAAGVVCLVGLAAGKKRIKRCARVLLLTRRAGFAKVFSEGKRTTELNAYYQPTTNSSESTMNTQVCTEISIFSSPWI